MNDTGSILPNEQEIVRPPVEMTRLEVYRLEAAPAEQGWGAANEKECEVGRVNLELEGYPGTAGGFWARSWWGLDHHCHCSAQNPRRLARTRERGSAGMRNRKPLAL